MAVCAEEGRREQDRGQGRKREPPPAPSPVGHLIKCQWREGGRSFVDGWLMSPGCGGNQGEARREDTFGRGEDIRGKGGERAPGQGEGRGEYARGRGGEGTPGGGEGRILLTMFEGEGGGGGG